MGQNQMRADLLLNPNYRCYFDRHREIPEHGGAPLPSEDFVPLRDGEGEDEIMNGDVLESSEVMNLSRGFVEPTESRLRAKRSKLSPSERLLVEWKLGDRKKQPGLPAHNFARGLRESSIDGSLVTRQPQKRCDSQAHTFKPGKMGVAYDDHGFVTEVFDDGPARTKGIKKGSRIVKVGSAPYSRSALVLAEKGSSNYQVTVEVAWFSGHSIHF